MAKWYVTAKKADFEAIGKRFDISPILARIIRNRDLITEDEIDCFLNGNLSALHSPLLMKDMEKTISILKEKIKQRKKIRVIGDYDIDGICASYILMEGLKEAGADVDVVIPHRIKDGYGLNDELIKDAADAQIDTIITCDNGIAAASQISYGKDMGLTLLVTDHHEVPYEETDGSKQYFLPPADAVIDPKQEACDYPYKEICGAVVAFKVIQALYGIDTLRMEDEFVLKYLPFAAFATIGDIMTLMDENRIIVKYGLQAFEQTKNLGLKALLTVNGLYETKLSPYHLGFVLGPCINATGRLDTAKRAMELFCAVTEREAACIAADLKALNDSRKELTKQGELDAIAQIEEAGLYKDDVLVVYLPDCHESLAGIIAGRVKDKYCKPAFVLTNSEDGIKGSGRSIEQFSMFESMTQIKDIFVKYGGHKLAAGLTIPAGKSEEFRTRINATSTLTKEDFVSKKYIDVPMPIVYATPKLIEELGMLQPYGNGNPSPLFAQKNISFVKGQLLGKERKVGRFTIKDEQGFKVDAVYFKEPEKMIADFEERYGKEGVEKLLYGSGSGIIASILYYPDINEFRGKKTLQLVITDYCFS